MDLIFDFFMLWNYFELWAEPVDFSHNGLVWLMDFIGYFVIVIVVLLEIESLS